MSYQPADASGAALLAVQASRALAAAGQGDMVWGTPASAILTAGVPG